MKKISFVFLFILLSLAFTAQNEAWAEDKKAWSDLMKAIYNGETAKYKSLIEKGADVTYQTKDGRAFTSMEIAMRKNNDTAVEALLATGKIKHPEHFFRIACTEQNEKTADLILKYTMDINIYILDSYTMLMHSCYFAPAKITQVVLKHKPDLELTQKGNGMTALMLAAKNGDPEKVKILLAAGANKSAVNGLGKTALNYVDEIPVYFKIPEAWKTEIRVLLN